MKVVDGHIDCHVISDLLHLLYVSFFYLPQGRVS